MSQSLVRQYALHAFDMAVEAFRANPKGDTWMPLKIAMLRLQQADQMPANECVAATGLIDQLIRDKCLQGQTWEEALKFWDC